MPLIPHKLIAYKHTRTLSHSKKIATDTRDKIAWTTFTLDEINFGIGYKSAHAVCWNYANGLSIGFDDVCIKILVKQINVRFLRHPLTLSPCVSVVIYPELMHICINDIGLMLFLQLVHISFDAEWSWWSAKKKRPWTISVMLFHSIIYKLHPFPWKFRFNDVPFFI